MFQFFREVCASVMIKFGNPIGGRDINGNPKVVEIDESKFGRRKYNRVGVCLLFWLYLCVGDFEGT